MILNWNPQVLGSNSERALAACANADYGGKGNALVRLSEAGYRVPRTVLFDLSQIEASLKSLGEVFTRAHHELVSWAKEGLDLAPLTEALQASVMPEAWRAVWQKVSAEVLGESGKIIVRSSVSCEDSTSCSFSGCFDSEVVKDPTAETVWKAILNVLSSVYGRQSAQRILASGLDPRAVLPGFLIQSFIEPQVAGVCFSRDPQNVWGEKLCVEWGSSGETVVQGTGEVKFARSNEAEPYELAPFWAELLTMAREIEILLRGPADIEWVWDGQKLWVVQSRLIATEEARLLARTKKGGRWSRELTLERFPKPLTPMGWSILQDSLEHNIRTLDESFGVVASRPEDIAVSVGGVIYSDPEFFKFPQGVRIKWGRYLAPWRKTFWRLANTLARFCGRVVVQKSKGVAKSLALLEIVDAVLGDKAREIEMGWAAHRDGCLENISSFLKKLDAMSGAKPAHEVLSLMEEVKVLSLNFLEPDLAIFLVKDSTYKALTQLWLELNLNESNLGDLLMLSRGNRTLEMNAEWDDLIAALKSDRQKESFLARLEQAASYAQGLSAGDVLDSATNLAWTRFLSRNGHNTTSWDVAVASWAENPAGLAPLLRVSLALPAKSILDRAAKRGEARQMLFDRLSEKGFSKSIPLVQKLLARVECFMSLDEEQHFLSGLLLVPSRKLIGDGERILMNRGQLRATSKAFYLTLAELKAELADSSNGPFRNLDFLAERRLSEWERSVRIEAPLELPVSVINDGIASPVQSEKMMIGRGVSQGVSIGPVHFAEHLHEVSAIPTGAILVTTAPNPALAPMFPMLGGLLTATGGPLSHGFVAAREYGIPAVSGVRNIFNRLKPGMQVRIDGLRGTVEILT